VRTEQVLKLIIFIVAGAAVAGLTACSLTAAPTAAPASHASAVRVPVSCSQQYRTWTHGQGKGVIAALDAVSSAETAGDAAVLTVTLNRAKPAISSAARYPIPSCADPRGYWYPLLMHVTAAASAGSASTVHAALRGVPEIVRELTVELKAV
jgi:hypothetical protein